MNPIEEPVDTTGTNPFIQVCAVSLYPLILIGGAALAGYALIHHLADAMRETRTTLDIYGEMLQDVREHRARKASTSDPNGNGDKETPAAEAQKSTPHE
ncbi:MAG: hypothetical protein HZB38_04375 [Planctomycetes bacterium]|nr:hypothetical protein [Planctomycetota bacterium]